MQPIDASFWRDITTPNRADLEALAINNLVIDDILHGGQRTKIEHSADGVFFVFYAFTFDMHDALELNSVPIYVFVTPQHLYTIHHGDVELIRIAHFAGERTSPHGVIRMVMSCTACWTSSSTATSRLLTTSAIMSKKLN